MNVASGVVSIEYSHFYIHEHVPHDAISAQVPDFRTDDPVILTPGQLTIVSEVQSHDAWVTLMLLETEPVQQTDAWQLLGTWPYRPVGTGRMSMSGPTTGPASPAMDWITGGQLDTPWLDLDPAAHYTAHVYAKGRHNSRARFEAAMDREEWGTHEGFEDYVIAFVPYTQPTGPHQQSRPAISTQ